MKKTIYTTKLIGTAFKYISRFTLKIKGWTVTGSVPNVEKYVIISAPHTSNWDFIYAVLMAGANEIDFHWMGKQSIFKWPFGTFMKWMGGIPVQREKSNNIVDETVDMFNKRENFIVAIQPEGSRDKVRYWKTGFYNIAHGADVPVLLAYLDYEKKECGFGPLFHLSDNLEDDMFKIKNFYVGVKGKRDNLFTEATLRDSLKEKKIS
jgi:1-acyl-sn-glycerol-3-phosphate acyltransferase